MAAMPNVAAMLFRKLAEDVAASGLIDQLTDFAKTCLQHSDKGVGLALLGVAGAATGAAAPVIALAALLTGPSLWEAHRDKKQRAALDDQLQKLMAFLHAVSHNEADANHKLDELLARSAPTLARTRFKTEAAAEEALHAEINARLRELQTAFPEQFAALNESLDDVRVVVSDSNFRVRLIDEKASELLEGQQRLEAMIGPIVDDYMNRLRNAESQVQALLIERDELRDKLASAMCEQARVGIECGQSVDEVLASLRRGDPHSLLSFLVTQAEQDDDELDRARNRSIARHRDIAAIAWSLGEFEKAKRSLHRIINLSGEDTSALNYLAMVHEIQGDLSTAITLHNRALMSARQSGNEIAEADSLGNLGLVFQAKGDLDAAKTHHELAAQIYNRSRKWDAEANTIGNLADVAYLANNLLLAKELANLARRKADACGHELGVAAAIQTLAAVEWRLGNLNESKRLFELLIPMSEQVKAPEFMACVLSNYGALLISLHQYDQAEEFLKRGLAEDRRLGRAIGIASDLNNLAIIAESRGDIHTARQYWSEAYSIYSSLGDERSANRVRNSLSKLPRSDNDPEFT